MQASQSSVLNTRKIPVEDLAGLSISKQEDTNVCNPNDNRNQKTFLVKECNRSMSSTVFYHDSEFLKLNKEQKLKLIQEHHQKIADINYENQSRRIVFKYGKPIIPRKGIPFNGNLDVDWKPEILDENQEKNKTVDDLMQLKQQSFSKSNDLENDSFASSSRPRRHVKRQTYTELLDSDDDDKIDDSDKPLPAKKAKPNDFCSSDEEIKWFYKSRKMPSKPPTSLSTFCDRTNEIFDNLKKQDDKKNKMSTIKSSLQKCVDNSGSSDSEVEQDFYQKYNVSATVHKEQSPTPTSPSSSSKLPKLTPKSAKLSLPTRRTPIRTSTYNSKYSSVAKAVPSTSKQTESSLITTSSFYGEKSSDRLDEHNNNKTNKFEDMIVCPICSQPFPKTEIEVHAAKCEQFQEPPSREVCEICNKSFPSEEITTHRTDCIRQLTEQSNERPTTSFLCEVCQKYLIDVDEIDHASKCIAKVRKDCK